MAACPLCEKLYRLDRAIEQRFSETMAEIDPPGNLYAKIKHDHNPDDLKFKLKRNNNYFVAIKNHDVRVWTDDGLVYAMVN